MKRLLRHFVPRNDTNRSPNGAIGPFDTNRSPNGAIGPFDVKLLILVLLFLKSFCAQAAVFHDLGNFKSIPILDNGRLKPIDTFARNLLTRFSGYDHYGKQDASGWLAAVLFNPTSTLDDKIFLINDPDIPQALGITPVQSRRYSARQLEQNARLLVSLDQEASKIPEKERSLAENEMIRVYDNLNVYTDLASCMLFAYPEDDFDHVSFIDVALKASTLKLDNHESIKIVSNLYHWSQNYKDLPLTVIPSGNDDPWTSPWDVLADDFGNVHKRRLVILWNNMTTDYLQGDEKGFNQNVELYLHNIRPMLGPQELKKLDKFPLEIFYEQSSVFSWSIMFYILSFIFFVISFSSSKTIWYNLGLLSIVAGFLPHLAGLVMRIIIMNRPPVSSLYETFIFVSLITVVLGLLIEYYNRQWLGIVTAAISGTALLFIANKYSAEGDTLKVLIAVLNSNFWLATHVTTITMGYGATCVGGILGHIWLVQAAFKKDQKTLEQTYKTILGILGVALTLTFLGTNLGGIWADQSWGRFWGWDPKENGALMIVLWTALLFHAKVANMIGQHGLAVGAVVGMMVVMWAWFGVNLLSVGLHSYGFTSGIAASLIIYAVLELLFLCITLSFIKWQKS